MARELAGQIAENIENVRMYGNKPRRILKMKDIGKLYRINNELIPNKVIVRDFVEEHDKAMKMVRDVNHNRPIADGEVVKSTIMLDAGVFRLIAGRDHKYRIDFQPNLNVLKERLKEHVKNPNNMIGEEQAIDMARRIEQGDFIILNEKEHVAYRSLEELMDTANKRIEEKERKNRIDAEALQDDNPVELQAEAIFNRWKRFVDVNLQVEADHDIDEPVLPDDVNPRPFVVKPNINKQKDNKQMIKNVTIGADPELFIFNTETRSVVSSIGLIPGEKGKPWRDKKWAKGYGLEIDNILGEFNIPPARTKAEFIESINFMKKYIREFVKKTNPNYDIRCRASYKVPEDQLQSDEAKKFGCSVDFNAYTEDVNPKPEGEKTNLRSAGFHIHIGYDNPNVETSVQLVKYLDLYLGLPSLFFDGDTTRRSLYGKAGCFRLTKYGVEYRVLSSALLRNKERLDFVWEGTMRAIKEYNNGSLLPDSGEIQEVINTTNLKMAEEIMDIFKIPEVK